MVQNVSAGIRRTYVDREDPVGGGSDAAMPPAAGIRDESVRRFFSRLEAAFNHALIEPEGTVQFAEVFADAFVAANPNGVMCWRNDDNLPQIMRQGFEFYRSIGAKSARIASLQVTSVDATHSFVQARWEMLFRKRGGELEAVADDVAYFVQTIEGDSKIFSYVTPDERQLFRERGLLGTVSG